MNNIAQYPMFEPLSLAALHSVKQQADSLHDGISEFTFGSLYFFKDFYHYKISRLDERTLIFLGEEMGQAFFFTLGTSLPESVVKELFADCSYWKLISESFLKENTALFDLLRRHPEEDRDNFDYLYTKLSLSTLQGKKLHKKKNHVNAFLQQYPDFSLKKLNSDTQEDAYGILEAWANDQPNLRETDYEAAQQALASLDKIELFGLVLYVQQTPVAWCLAELAAHGTIAVVHFEKARTDFRGSYQYINYAFAQSLPEHVQYINREQDLGDEGLRRAKLSYRPDRFIKKYRLIKGAN